MTTLRSISCKVYHGAARPRRWIAARTAVAMLAAIAGGLLQTNAATAAEPNAWKVLKGERAALSLDGTVFAGKQTDNMAFRHDTDGRSDWIQAGTLAMSEPNVTIVVTRKEDPRTFRYSIVKNLEDFAELKSVPKEFKPVYYEMGTWIGTLRGVEFEVNADGVLKHCVGFHKPGTSKVNIRGYLCSPDEAIAAPERVACLIDKLRFVNAADDRMIRTLVAAEQVSECGARRLEPASRPVKPDEVAKETL